MKILDIRTHGNYFNVFLEGGVRVRIKRLFSDWVQCRIYVGRHRIDSDIIVVNENVGNFSLMNRVLEKIDPKLYKNFVEAYSKSK